MRLNDILNGFQPRFQEAYAFTGETKKYRKGLARYVRPKDQDKIRQALKDLLPFIINKATPQPNSPLSIYDFHILKTGNRGDFHVSSYTIILQYNEYDHTVIADEVGGYGNIGIH